MARIPPSCPEGFFGRYTVIQGDTFYNISQIFRVRLEALAVNNPHITNPNIIYPGDVLCVPGFIRYPCCVTLTQDRNLPFGAGGTVFIGFAPQGGQSVSFSATLPEPSAFGDFNSYTGEIFIPGIGGFGNELQPNSQDPPSWSVRIDLPSAATVMPYSEAIIKPFNNITSTQGPVLLQGTIKQMCVCE